MKNYPSIGSRYQHYKGGIYLILQLCKHTETGEDMVFYQSEHFGSFYVRPLDSFNELVDNIPRFDLLF